MEKYLIATDSTSALDKNLAKKNNIELVSLSVIIDGKEYKDQIDITTEEFNQVLLEGKVPSTSQPNPGYLIELLEKWKKENYEAIIVCTCSSDLSGTNNGFHLAKDTVGLDNMTIFDTRQVGAPVMDMAITAKKLADAGKTVDEILAVLEIKKANTFSMLYPENFTQLERSGRLSPAAARIGNLFKMKVLLYLEKEGKYVDKYGISRTELKIFKDIVSKFGEDGVNSKDHKIYISHANNEEKAEKLKKVLRLAFKNIEIEITQLPAVLTCHGGVGCLAVHYTYKVEGL